MALARRDDWLTDAQGRALSGAQVFYCLQPATTSSLPPSPLATIFSDLASTPATNPQVTDGFGHAVAYLDDSVLYTMVFVHPLFGANPVVLTDQTIGGGGGGGTTNTPVQVSTTASTITGAIPGSVFTLPSLPIANTLVLAQNGIVLTLNLGYTISSQVITLATALQSGDNLYALYYTA